MAGVATERRARAGSWVAGRPPPTEAPSLLTRRPGGNTVLLAPGGAALAAEMASAVAREAGAAGRYDAARKCFVRTEQQLLTRVACGSARAFREVRRSSADVHRQELPLHKERVKSESQPRFIPLGYTPRERDSKSCLPD